MAAKDPLQRSINARIAALSRWAGEDGAAAARKGQQALRESFERQVDPDGELPPEERARRAFRAYRAHMLRIGKQGRAARAAKRKAAA